jgi:hypothetical protein
MALLKGEIFPLEIGPVGYKTIKNFKKVKNEDLS